MSEQGSSKATCENLLRTKPPCLIVLGMAGSGKSSFVQVTLIDLIKLTFRD